jgi:hypothetical protein
MANHAQSRSFYDFGKQQRIVLSCSVIVALFLIFVGHIPILPVLAGCALAIGFSVLRSSSSTVVARKGARKG